MDIYIGSLNQTKLKAVESIFPTSTIIGNDVPSGVSKQPIGDEETQQGAIHRAKHLKKYSNSITIGLEGGVMYMTDTLYLCNWGALIDDENHLYTAAGARIQLPHEFISQLDAGYELSEIMNEYTKREDIRNHEGAIGIFTNDLIDRTSMFAHVVTLLKGQMEYANQ